MFLDGVIKYLTKLLGEEGFVFSLQSIKVGKPLPLE